MLCGSTDPVITVLFAACSPVKAVKGLKSELEVKVK